MLIGTINEYNPARAAYADAVIRAIDFLRSKDFTKLEDGRYEIEGDLMYATVSRYTTKPAKECFPESHRRYYDVQFLAEGEEHLGWCPFTPDLKVKTPYDEEKDITFYEKLVPESNFVLKPGVFAVLTTKDVHCPCRAIDDKPGKVLKVVVKVSTELLKDE
ncbi:NanQ anomerase/TabA/YiaL family protein [Schwartzia sp. (in: firmicutes)]